MWWRLWSSGWAKAALWLSVAAGVLFALFVLVLAAKGRAHEVVPVARRCALVVAWIAGTLLGAWCASDLPARDEADGVAALGARHGLGAADLGAGRALAATLAVASLVLGASLVPALAVLAVSPSWHALGRRLLALLPLAAFAAGVGVVAGALASACGAVAPRRARSLLAALIFVPWALEGALWPAHASVGSLPSLLGSLADLVVRVGGAR
jgi:hypothetical protein